MKCMLRDCRERSIIHIIPVNNRMCDNQLDLCSQHAGDYEPFRMVDQASELGHRRDMVRFEIKFVVFFDEWEGQGLYLAEVSGSRKFNLPIGIVEASLIVNALTGASAPRPFTHQATARIIDSLGGKVEKVIVNELDQEGYHAHVHIRQGNENVSVDIRPSDAIGLAIVSSVPILISGDVLERAWKSGWNR